jgi:hypothetical protein
MDEDKESESESGSEEVTDDGGVDKMGQIEGASDSCNNTCLR